MVQRPNWREQVGEAGETAVADILSARGWQVEDLNAYSRNYRNVDLIAQKGNLTVHIQVKTYNDYGWISGGGLNERVVSGTSGLFNRASGDHLQADYIIFLSPSRKGDKKKIATEWRYFVVPVLEAERLWRKHIDGIMSRPKRDGSRRSPNGAVQDWVGPGPKPLAWGPDLSTDYARYEDAFDLLES